VVTRDVAPGATVAGSPARVLEVNRCRYGRPPATTTIRRSGDAGSLIPVALLSWADRTPSWSELSPLGRTIRVCSVARARARRCTDGAGRWLRQQLAARTLHAPAPIQRRRRSPRAVAR